MDNVIENIFSRGIPLEEILAVKGMQYGLKFRSFLYPAQMERLNATFRCPQALADSGIAPQFRSDTIELAISNPEALDIAAFQDSGVEVVIADQGTVADFWEEVEHLNRDGSRSRKLEGEDALLSLVKALESIAIREFYFLEENVCAESTPLVLCFLLAGEVRQYFLSMELTKSIRLLLDNGGFAEWFKAVFGTSFDIEQSEIVCRSWHCYRIALVRRCSLRCAPSVSVESVVAAASEQDARGFRAGRILLVDDDRRFISLLERVLVQAGHEVSVSYGAAEALRLIEQAALGGAFDIVISDMHMPATSGEEFFKELRRRSVDTPVVMLTSDDSSVLEAAMLRRGVSAFIDKTRDPEIVLAWCANIISSRLSSGGNLTAESQAW